MDHNRILDALERMAREHCHTEAGETDSGAISANANALELLAEHGRFRVVRSAGRMVVGRWPENAAICCQKCGERIQSAPHRWGSHQRLCGLCLDDILNAEVSRAAEQPKTP